MSIYIIHFLKNISYILSEGIKFLHSNQKTARTLSKQPPAARSADLTFKAAQKLRAIFYLINYFTKTSTPKTDIYP